MNFFISKYILAKIQVLLLLFRISQGKPSRKFATIVFLVTNKKN